MIKDLTRTGCVVGIFLQFISQTQAIEIEADELISEQNGDITAVGDVRITRGQERLRADKVLYNKNTGEISAAGSLSLCSDEFEIHASHGTLDAKSYEGSFRQMSLKTNQGVRVSAEDADRDADGRYFIRNVKFTLCPEDQEHWSLTSKQAMIDEPEGILKARHVTLRIADIPVAYVPYWQHAFKRHSGFLLPEFATGKRRGTELILPYYFAPARRWDATAAFHSMSARGFRPELEVRHISRISTLDISGEWMRDTLIHRQRFHLNGESSLKIGPSIGWSTRINHVSDFEYLADFKDSIEETSLPYVSSDSRIYGHHSFFQWSIAGHHFQSMRTSGNASTIQTWPDMHMQTSHPLGKYLNASFNQGITRFYRRQGSHGWRSISKPGIRLSSNTHPAWKNSLSLQASYSRYSLSQTTSDASPSRTTTELHGQSEIIFQKKYKSVNHQISPVLRYDLVASSDQSRLPNFDSSFGSTTLNTLLSGNRFSGQDRIEQANRISLMLKNRLQHKHFPIFRQISLHSRTGTSYSFRARQPGNSTSRLSDLFGDLDITTGLAITLNAVAQYNVSENYFSILNSHLTWQGPLSVSFQYRFTDTRFSGTEEQSFSLKWNTNHFEHWEFSQQWIYNIQTKQTQDFNVKALYRHACWSAGVEAYRNSAPSGSSNAANIGAKFLLDLPVGRSVPHECEA